MKARSFIDTVKVRVLGGRGGNGCASFRRERGVPHGGPDGGDGGKGGDVILRGDRDEDSLVRLYFAQHQRGGAAGHGRGKRLHGRSGRTLFVRVPLGTEVWDDETGELVGDIVEDGGELLVAHGGKGGLGNWHWRSPTRQAPLDCTTGEAGEERTLRLELKLLADLGLVGFPNAGKSSLLSRLSRAHPKVGAYPFTTLNPIIGTVVFDDYSRVRVADVPGLIEGAHDGKGLGHAFLRHIERSPALMFVIDMAGVDGRSPADDFHVLRRELALYDPELAGRPHLVVANKMDLPEAKENLGAFEQATGVAPLCASAATGDGIPDLRRAIRRLFGEPPASGSATRRTA